MIITTVVRSRNEKLQARVKPLRLGRAGDRPDDEQAVSKPPGQQTDRQPTKVQR
jgi:hypothetical protein